MRSLPLIAIALAAATVLAGCAARGSDDPFGYLRKPLYAGGFDLADIAGSEKTQRFLVEDGSIASLQVQVWINATAGGARVSVIDPSGAVAVDTAETVTRLAGLDLGDWTIKIEATPDAAGDVSVLVTRA